MIPKVETCIEAVKKGAEAAVILDGRVPHAVLLELFTSQGHGTIIRDNRAPTYWLGGVFYLFFCGTLKYQRALLGPRLSYHNSYLG